MRRSLLLLTCALVVVTAGHAMACLWDHDTLRAEAKGMPGVAEIITGRFERNPSWYYEMRLERAAQRIEANSKDWAAYDDVGVACDRLGRHDEAIEWMARKFAAMSDASITDVSGPDIVYRHLANLGTFHAHRWFALGADRSDLADMQRGIDLIERAIKLNPDAHFGRERYQLLAMKWVVNPPEVGATNSGSDLPHLFLAHDQYRTILAEGKSSLRGGVLQQAGLGDAVQGLTGLIALGNAWESVDVFYALMIALHDRGDAALAHLAKLRCLELIGAGRGSIHPQAPTGTALEKSIVWRGYTTSEDRDIEIHYKRARASADAWHAERTQFMLARLNANRHPDIDSQFWDGYIETPAVKPPNGFFGMGRIRAEQNLLIVMLIAGAALIGAGSIHILRKLRKKRATTGTNSGE